MQISSLTRLIVLTLLAFVYGCASPPSGETVFGINQAKLDALKLSYYSDYVSFIGRDKEGIVAFALDTNRGRDQETWQADHFVALYDEKAGWQPVKGNGPYPNNSHELATIPNSPFFAFFGTPEAWWHIRSAVNSLDLNVEPMRYHIDRRQGLAVYRLGSAGAALAWRNRVIEGRLIYEHLFLPGFNRLSHRYVGGLRDFHGLYLSVDGEADLYLHHQAGPGFAPLINLEEGFFSLNSSNEPLHALTIEATKRKLGIGFYRWPVAWHGSFSSGSSTYVFNLELSAPKTIANWVVGGFAMGIVRGTLDTPDGPKSVVGLGELIM